MGRTTILFRGGCPSVCIGVRTKVSKSSSIASASTLGILGARVVTKAKPSILLLSKVSRSACVREKVLRGLDKMLGSRSVLPGVGSTCAGRSKDVCAVPIGFNVPVVRKGGSVVTKVASLAARTSTTRDRGSDCKGLGFFDSFSVSPSKVVRKAVSGDAPT